MVSYSASPSDSHRITGGEIPGMGGAAAFTLGGPQPSQVPVLIAVPHGGRVYPAALLERMRHPGIAALRLEDRHVDRLAEAAAQASGAALLTAQAPRAMIDLNRSVDDIDWDMIAGGAPEGTSRDAAGHRARSGLGLIPRRLPGLGEVWKRPHDRAELAARICGIHTPYHECLSQTLQAVRARWGTALLIDLHSMPPLPSRLGQPAPELVLGDRFGSSCDAGVVASAFSWLGARRRRVAHNRPYAGGYVLERHGAPNRGIHAIQIEIDRRCYLDSQMVESGPGFAEMADLLGGLVRHLAAEVGAMTRGDVTETWADAAE